MVFSSLSFLFVFLPIVVILYHLARTINWKNLVLLVSSLVFYAWGEPVYVILMLVSTANDYLHALVIDALLRMKHRGLAKVFLVSSFFVNLGLLSFYKYSDFVISSINTLTGASLPLLNLPLPVGISFYTFQTMSYTIDVYRREVKVQRNILTLATYVTMFPQLIAGPIVRYETIEQELRKRDISWGHTALGLRRFIAGLAKKVVIANQMAILADASFNMADGDRGLLMAWLGIIAYAFQIYFDFSGYSDMAIGLGHVFGFHFLENFNYPYISRSVTEFWRRWHISLSTWFRDYVYIPLGGNRGSAANWLRNIFIVWAMTGLWHGAAWNFVFWGLFFGVLLVIERIFLLGIIRRVPPLGYVYAMLSVLVGWVLFRSESLDQVKNFLKAMLGFHGTNPFSYLVQNNLVYLLPFMILAAIGSTPLPKMAADALARSRFPKLLLDIGYAFLFALSVLFLVNESFNPFIYYRF
ncbi:MAG: MBOAT family protein [Clostridia bacterium]|nr:MBOAT family protein [Clostridia bacterium]